jgi:hypothetical protein
MDNNVIKAMETVKPVDVQSRFIIADIQLNQAHNAQVAQIMFEDIVDKIEDDGVKPEPTEIGETEMIIDRIQDYQARNMIPYDIPMQQALVNVYNAKEKLTQKASSTEEKLAQKKTWTSDRQNVHDSKINEEMVNQIQKIRSDNSLDIDNNHSFADFQTWARKNISDRKQLNVLDRFRENNPVPGLNGLGERDLVEILWKRVHDKKNKDRQDDLKEAVLDSIKDCVENGNVVCLTGRTTKMWQSLAVLDADDKIGVMKSKQMLRNEFYDRCAKVTKEVLDTVEPELKETYEKGEEGGEPVTEMIKEKMDEIAQEMQDKFEPETLQRYLEECKSVA